MPETVTGIFRKDAQELMAWVGWKKTAKWDNEKLASKLAQVPSARTTDDPPEDENVATTLLKVETALEDDGTFEVFGEENQTLEEYQASLDAAEDADLGDEKAEASPEAAKEEAEESPKEEKAEAKEAPKEDKAEKPKAEKKASPKKRANTRNYCAGVVINKSGGYKDGMEVTDEMVAEVNDLFGAANDSTSRGALNNALQVLQGYNAE